MFKCVTSIALFFLLLASNGPVVAWDTVFTLQDDAILMSKNPPPEGEKVSPDFFATFGDLHHKLPERLNIQRAISMEINAMSGLPPPGNPCCAACFCYQIGDAWVQQLSPDMILILERSIYE